MQSVTPVDAPCRGDHSGTFAIAVGLTGSEKSSVSDMVAVVSKEVGDDMWGHPVSDSVLKMNFSILQIWMNSDSFCYFCVELFRVPKIMKIFV